MNERPNQTKKTPQTNETNRIQTKLQNIEEMIKKAKNLKKTTD